MEWEIVFYEDLKHRSPVADFLEELSPQERAKAIWAIDLLERTGVRLTEPYAKHLQGKLWELRVHHSRILYCVQRRTCVLLHAFRKTTQKTPTADIALALQRMRAYLERRDT